MGCKRKNRNGRIMKFTGISDINGIEYFSTLARDLDEGSFIRPETMTGEDKNHQFYVITEIQQNKSELTLTLYDVCCDEHFDIITEMGDWWDVLIDDAEGLNLPPTLFSDIYAEDCWEEEKQQSYMEQMQEMHGLSETDVENMIAIEEAWKSSVEY